MSMEKELIESYAKAAKALKAEGHDINEYLSNEHIARVFEDVARALSWETKYPEEFAEAGIEIKKFIPVYFKSLEGKSQGATLALLGKATIAMNEYKNEIRNNLILMDTRLEKLMKKLKPDTFESIRGSRWLLDESKQVDAVIAFSKQMPSVAFYPNRPKGLQGYPRSAYETFCMFDGKELKYYCSFMNISQARDFEERVEAGESLKVANEIIDSPWCFVKELGKNMKESFGYGKSYGNGSMPDGESYDKVQPFAVFSAENDFEGYEELEKEQELGEPYGMASEDEEVKESLLNKGMSKIGESDMQTERIEETEAAFDGSKLIELSPNEHPVFSKTCWMLMNEIAVASHAPIIKELVEKAKSLEDIPRLMSAIKKHISERENVLRFISNRFENLEEEVDKMKKSPKNESMSEFDRKLAALKDENAMLEAKQNEGKTFRQEPTDKENKWKVDEASLQLDGMSEIKFEAFKRKYLAYLKDDAFLSQIKDGLLEIFLRKAFKDNHGVVSEKDYNFLKGELDGWVRNIMNGKIKAPKLDEGKTYRNEPTDKNGRWRINEEGEEQPAPEQAAPAEPPPADPAQQPAPASEPPKEGAEAEPTVEDVVSQFIGGAKEKFPRLETAELEKLVMAAFQKIASEEAQGDDSVPKEVAEKVVSEALKLCEEYQEAKPLPDIKSKFDELVSPQKKN
jgi:hypothetical protein